MSEMVERMAKALFRRAVERDVVDDTPDEWADLRESFELDASAALEAMREPTLAMSLSGMAVIMDELKIAIPPEMVDRMFRAMIAAGLDKP